MIELSVIIATYNRAQRLRLCLEALAQQTQPATDFEVIVVVDGSTDDTPALLANLTTPYLLRVIYQPNGGQPAALNRGIVEASGRYCLILDDDMIAAPTLVAAHLQAQREQGGVVALGDIDYRLPAQADWFARCFAEGWTNHYKRLRQGIRTPTWTDCYSGNLSVPRAALLEVGLFAVDLPAAFDLELGYRLERQGLPLVYLPAAAAEHHDDKDFRALVASSEREGRVAVELYRRHPAMLPELLGTFGEAPLRVIVLRRLLLALRIPPRALGLVARLQARRGKLYAWYRFLASYAYWWGVRQAMPDGDTWQRLTHGVPILMYHAVGHDTEAPSRYVVPVRRFAQHMAWLKWLRYHVLSLDEFLHYRRTYRLPPARSVVITLDDGYADNSTLAYPVLRRYGFPATIFLVTDKVGGTNDWDENGGVGGRRLMSWSDIRGLLRGGVRFGGHTRHHPSLKTIATHQAQEEVEGSRADLERELKTPVHAFAYPYGVYNSETQALVQQAGYWGGCGVKSGINTLRTPNYALRRIEIWGSDSWLAFLLKLWSGTSRVGSRSK